MWDFAPELSVNLLKDPILLNRVVRQEGTSPGQHYGRGFLAGNEESHQLIP